MRIVFAPYEHLIVTRSARDEAVLVLRPPGQDAHTVLCVARVVLPTPEYRALADILGSSD